MPLQICKGDITEVKADAVVRISPAREDGRTGRSPNVLHENADSADACGERGRISVTKARNLPVRYLIHIPSPDWEHAAGAEEIALRLCYAEALRAAEALGCKSVAVPLIEGRSARRPYREALHTAVEAAGTFLQDSDTLVKLIVPADCSGGRRPDRLRDLERYLIERLPEPPAMLSFAAGPTLKREPRRSHRRLEAERFQVPLEAPSAFPGLKDVLSQAGESFSEMLLRKIDEKGMTDAECYHRANLDRRLFSKIRSRKEYQPSKSTVLACAIALELPLDETEEMLQKAGFALSPASKSDLIVEFFIERGNYNIFDINEALFEFGQKTLGVPYTDAHARLSKPFFP